MGRGALDILQSARQSAANVRFIDLCKLVEALGYSLRRQEGSHRVYTADGLPMINLQRGPSGKAKPYQVKQVLEIVEKHDLSLE